MKYLKNIILAATLSVASLGLTSFSANATIITQTIEANDDIVGIFDLGFITVEIDDPMSILEVTLLGQSFAFGDFIVDDLDVTIDTDNVSAGIEYLFLNVTDIKGIPPYDWTYQILVDTFNPENNSLNIFDSADVIIAAGTARLTNLTLTNLTLVPEPPTVAFFSLALIVMGMRRRVSK